MTKTEERRLRNRKEDERFLIAGLLIVAAICVLWIIGDHVWLYMATNGELI